MQNTMDSHNTYLGMDGILQQSDSNDSTSSSTENGLNSFINSAAASLVPNGHLSHQIGDHQSVFHTMTASLHATGMTNGNNMYQPQQQQQQVQHQHANHMMSSEKRKHDDGHNGTGHEQPSTKKLPPPNGKKTKGRVKIKMEFIDNKLRRYTTFSKRKTGIMKKAYELSTLTGTQVMLLVASETGHVYTFATRKLQPMITSEAGKALIQTCLNSPDPSNGGGDQRMCATGFEETDLTYTVNDDSSEKEEDSSESVPGLQFVTELANSSSSNNHLNNTGNNSGTNTISSSSIGNNNNEVTSITYSTPAGTAAALQHALTTTANSQTNGQAQPTAILLPPPYAQLQGALPLTLLQAGSAAGPLLSQCYAKFM